MNCSSVELLLEADIDGELEPAQQFQLREHLEGCAACQGHYADLRKLQEDIRTKAPYYRAPDALRSRVQAAIHQTAGPAIRPAQTPWKWLALAASVLLMASLGANVFLSNRAIPENELVAQQIMSEHVRSLLTNHQIDVVSSDRHTVKPWFGDKLDFSPDVKDLAAQGFPLVGGRVDYINRRPVAALVFHRAKHVINLFTWPAGLSATGVRSQDGYHAVAWAKDGMTYWAISDLNAAELEQFARLYQN